jgi:hypothetical protein
MQYQAKLTQTAMSNKRIPPTPGQRCLVDVGMFIQFHLAAVGHLIVWLWMFYELLYSTIPDGWTYEEWHWKGDGFILEIFVYQGIPISFGILVAVYIFFRCLLAYANFRTALIVMVAFDIIHSLLMCFTIIVPARLIIPIMLYAMACRRYN